MKRLELIENGNTQTLLTVATDRVTIKLKAGLSMEERARAEAFLKRVAEVLVDAEFTMRGTLQDRYQITMKSGKVSRTFYEEEFSNRV